MAPTINGKRTGRAGAEERRDVRENIAREQEKEIVKGRKAETLEVCQQIADILGTAEYQKWLDHTSSYNFLSAAKNKLAALQLAGVSQPRRRDDNLGPDEQAWLNRERALAQVLAYWVREAQEREGSDNRASTQIKEVKFGSHEWFAAIEPIPF